MERASFACPSRPMPHNIPLAHSAGALPPELRFHLLRNPIRVYALRTAASWSFMTPIVVTTEANMKGQRGLTICFATRVCSRVSW